jgi:catechol 2,3-dioxygenase
MNMEMKSALLEQANFSIHADTRLGSISLSVADLKNEIAFYTQALGMQVLSQDEGQARLGIGGRELLHLQAEPQFKRYSRVAGLYHFALLYPNRKAFARAVARLFALQVPNSPTDHIMTKSTYLEDPEGNGIELYCESPEDGEFIYSDGIYAARRSNGTLSDGREAMDLEALFGLLEPKESLDGDMDAGVHLGHMHLHMGSVDDALNFYQGVLGFDLMGRADRYQMAFVSAGGYHHHIGLNTWQGVGAPPPPEDALGLRYFSIVLPNQETLDAVLERVAFAGLVSEEVQGGVVVEDPSRHRVLLTLPASG